MATTPLIFEFTADTSTQQFTAELNKKSNVQPVSQQKCVRTYYDSFDWRLFAAGLLCEIDETKKTLTLIELQPKRTYTPLIVIQVPKFAWEIDKGRIKDTLKPLLEMRALLPVLTLESRCSKLVILNKDEKTVLRLVLEEYDNLTNRVTLIPVKGYDKAFSRSANILENKLGLKVAHHAILTEALKQQGRNPLDYSSKLNIQLAPDMRADIACKYIFSHLLATAKVNEPGTIDDIDSEFLHDFRVSIRRTRSGLSQFKGVLPSETTAKFAEYFAWLGQITSFTRDMDVYLLNFDSYKSSLPISIREDLNPLFDFIKIKQKDAHKELARKLKSAKYKDNLSSWEHYLKDPLPKNSTEPNAMLPIKELADRRIWKVYKRILKEGGAITDDSPAQTLHDLRKTCKKLRYLMEFFQSLYSEKQIKSLIKTLKGFQEVLGDFQDYETQEITLKQFSDEMLNNKTPAATFLAMGVLIQILDKNRCKVRKDFTKRFSDFTLAENQAAFQSLFAAKF